MKQKYVWITFLISLFTLIPYRIYQRIVLGQSAGKIFGIGTNDIGIISGFVVFVLLIIIMTNLLKDSDVAIRLKKNTLTGLLGLASGVSILISSFVKLTYTIPLLSENKGQVNSINNLTKGRTKEVKEFLNTQISVQNIAIVAAVLGIAGFAGLVFFALMSFKGGNKLSRFSLISLLPSIWAIACLIEVFMARTSLVAESVDLFDVLSCALLMMFLFTQAKFFVKIKDLKLSKKLLRSGLIAVLSMLAYSIPSLASSISAGTLISVDFWKHLSNIILALYITMFLFDSRNNVQEIVEEPQESSENQVEVKEQSITQEGQENKPAVDVEMFHVNDMIDKLEELYT